MKAWKKYTLEEVCTRIYSGGTPSTKHPEYWNGTCKWLSSGETAQRFIYDTERKITELGISHSSTKLAKKGCTVIATAGQGYTRGQASYLMTDTYMNQSLIACEPNSEIIDSLYLYYNLDNRYEEFRLLSDGTSTRGGLSGWIIKRMEISLPDIVTQRIIAGFLNDLDRRIENNNCINKNLAEQIRTLCNAWLNDYTPFEGKCPDDWILTPLSSIATFISGYSYKGDELQESSIAMATIKNFNRHGGFKLDGYKEITPSGRLKPEHFVSRFDTLVAHTDLTQNAEVIGNAEPVLSFSDYSDIIFSMDIVKVLPNNPEISKFLIAAMLQTQQFKSHCLGYVNGTTVLHLSKKALPEYSLMLPKQFSVLKPLDEAVSSMYRQMALNIDEIFKLTKLRDHLLPRLMSGELDVSELEI